MSNEIPPMIVEAETQPVRAPVAQWRWWIHLAVLASSPLLAGLLGLIRRHDPVAAVPPTVGGLLRVTAGELTYFAGLFAVAWVFSRVNRRQLLLTWRGGLFPVFWGFLGSIALRLLIFAVMATVVMLWLLWESVLTGKFPGQLNPAFRPQIEHLLDPAAVTHDPVYFILLLTLVSFVLAGLREELWRSGMLAGIKALFPKSSSHWAGKAAAVMIVAVIFGLGHALQGWAGVGITTILGIGLGLMMLWRQSMWEAVFAHGFFDASTFVFLYLIVKFHSDQLPGF